MGLDVDVDVDVDVDDHDGSCGYVDEIIFLCKCLSC